MDGELAALYDACAAMAYWTVYGVTNNRHTAEELTQTVFLRAWERWGTVGSLNLPRQKAWVWRTARNLAIDSLRREKSVYLMEEPPEAVAPLGRAETPEEVLVKNERAETVWRAVTALPEPYRQAVLLHYYAEAPDAEAARALGVPGGTYRSRLSRARKLLNTALKNEVL